MLDRSGEPRRVEGQDVTSTSYHLMPLFTTIRVYAATRNGQLQNHSTVRGRTYVRCLRRDQKQYTR